MVSAGEGNLPQPGTIYIASPDHHMLLDAQAIRLSHGLRERHTKPAIDPLFRSGALHCGSRAIGVVLTEMLDDGSAGLRAIKESGGTAVVQNPADAHAPRIPQNALDCVTADHVVPLAQLGSLLYELACRVAAAPSGLLQRPDRLARPASDGLHLLHSQGAASGSTPAINATFLITNYARPPCTSGTICHKS